MSVSKKTVFQDYLSPENLGYKNNFVPPKIIWNLDKNILSKDFSGPIRFVIQCNVMSTYFLGPNKLYRVFGNDCL